MIKKLLLMAIGMSTTAWGMEQEQQQRAPGIVSFIVVNSTNGVMTLSSNFARRLVAWGDPLSFDRDGRTYTMKHMSILDPNGDGKTIVINPGEAVYYANMQEDEQVEWYPHALASMGARFIDVSQRFTYNDIVNRGVSFVMMKEDAGTVYSTYSFAFIVDREKFEALRNQMKPIVKSLPEDVKKQLLGKTVTIVDKSKWQELRIESKFKQYDQVSGTIRSIYQFSPGTIKQGVAKIVVFVIHGTWSEHAAAFKDINDEWYQHILKYAQGMAEKKQTAVEVVSYGWKGINATDERVAAGKNLALIISQFYNDYEVVTIAHSHGCNVAIAASRYLVNKPINLMLNMGAPVRDITDDEFVPMAVKKLVAFYSTSDWVQAVGAINLGALFEKEGSIRKFMRRKGMEVYNIRVQFDGAEPPHSDAGGIRRVGLYLAQIMPMLSLFKYNNDLDMNIRTEVIEKDPVIIAIRNYITVENIIRYPDLEKQTMNKDLLWDFMDHIKKEVAYSKKEEEKFERIYNRSIHYKATMLYRGAVGTLQEIYNKLPAMGSMPLPAWLKSE